MKRIAGSIIHRSNQRRKAIEPKDPSREILHANNLNVRLYGLKQPWESENGGGASVRLAKRAKRSKIGDRSGLERDSDLCAEICLSMFSLVLSLMFIANA